MSLPALLSIALVWGACSVGADDLVRERNEATLYCPASNVAGSGNITLYTGANGYVGTSSGGIIPVVGGQLGVGGLMQFSAQAAFPSFNHIGLTQAHIELTSPGNDRLRPFGIGLIGDLYLSSDPDTISLALDAARPDYSPFLRATFTADLDWLALFKWLPLKTYLSISMSDNPQLLYRYELQLAPTVGVEWKLVEHSLFLDAGAAFYREKANRLNKGVGDTRFEQSYVWVAPGGRYRLLKRFSIVGSTKFQIFKDVKKQNPLEVENFSAMIRLEVPLLYTETNTEAIRTLVFMDQEKTVKRKPVKVARAGGQTNQLLNEFDMTFKELSDTAQLQQQQKTETELKNKREDAQKRMDAIEQMLKESQ